MGTQVVHTLQRSVQNPSTLAHLFAPNIERPQIYLLTHYSAGPPTTLLFEVDASQCVVYKAVLEHYVHRAWHHRPLT